MRTLVWLPYAQRRVMFMVLHTDSDLFYRTMRLLTRIRRSAQAGNVHGWEHIRKDLDDEIRHLLRV